MSGLVDFLVEHRFVFLFYSIIVFLVYVNRKKFDIQAKILALYKTKIGLKVINKIGNKHREIIKVLGLSGIGVGFIIMIYISFTLIKNLYDLLTIDGAQSAIALVLPGVRIPGSPIFIPLITGWLALFFVILVHEFAHGIVAVAHKIKVKSSGIFFLGPLMGAFVEPDEKQLTKKSDAIQYSVFAAGPFSNILLALLIAVITMLLLNPVLTELSEPIGFSIEGVTPGTPAEAAGLKPGMLFTSANNEPIIGYEPFILMLNKTKPGEVVNLGTAERNYPIKTAPHPQDPNKPFIGITGIMNEVKVKQQYQNLNWLNSILLFLSELFGLIVLLSLGIGVANLLPLGIADGGRMLQIVLKNTMGLKKGNKLWKDISILCLLLLVLNLILGIALPLFG